MTAVRSAQVLPVATADGERCVVVEHEEGGLAVTQSVDAVRIWNVTHVASGRTVARNFASVDAAHRAMVALLAVGDWTRDGDAILADTAFLARAKSVRAKLEVSP